MRSLTPSVRWSHAARGRPASLQNLLLRQEKLRRRFLSINCTETSLRPAVDTLDSVTPQTFCDLMKAKLLVTLHSRQNLTLRKMNSNLAAKLRAKGVEIHGWYGASCVQKASMQWMVPLPPVLRDRLRSSFCAFAFRRSVCASSAVGRMFPFHFLARPLL